MAGISVGSVSVSVVPEVRGFARTLGRQLLPDAARIGREIGRVIAEGINAQLRDINISIDTAGVMAQIASLNQVLDRLDGRALEVKIDVDVSGAVAEVTQLNELLDRLDGRHVEVNVDTDRGVGGVAQLTGGLGLLSKALSPAKLLVPLASAGLAAGAVATTAVSAAAALAPVVAGLFSIGQAAVAAAPALIALRVGGLFVAQTFKQIFDKGSAASAALKPLADRFKEAGAAASRAAAAGIRPLSEGLVRVAGPVVQAAMVKIGQATNRVMREFLAWGQSAKGVEAIKGIVGPIGDAMKALAPNVSRLLISFTSMLGRITGVSVAAGRSGLAGIIDGLADRFDRINAGTVQAGMDKLWRSFVTVRNVASTVVGWIGKVVTAYKTYTTQFRAVADAVSVAAIIFGGPVTAVIGAVGLIIRHFDELKAAWRGLKAGLSSPTAGGVFADFKSFAGTVLPAVKTAFAQVKAIVLPVLQDIWQKITKNLVPAFSGLVRALGPVVAWFIRVLGPAVATTFANIMRIVGGAIDIISGIFKVFTAVLTGDWSKAWDGLKDIVGGSLGIVGGIVRQIWNLIITNFRIGAGVIQGVLQVAWSIIGPIFRGIGAALQAVGRFAMWLWNAALGPAFRGIAAVVMWLWNNAVGPAFRGIVTLGKWLFTVIATAIIGPLVVQFRVWAAVARWLWTSVISPVFRGIAAVVQFSWGIMRTIFTAIAGVVRTVLGTAFSWLRTVVSVVWAAIQLQIRVAAAAIRAIWAGIKAYIDTVLAPVFRWLLNNVIKPVWNAIKTAIQVAWVAIRIIWTQVRTYLANTLAAAFNTFRSVVSTVWNAVKATISAVWNGGIKPAFNALKSGVEAVRNAFSTAVAAIRKIWDGLKAATRGPVQFVVNTVYNNGIKKAWNLVAGIVNLPKLPDFTFARGGVVPAGDYGILPGYSPGRDTMLAAVSPGEAWIRPDATRALGPGFIHGLNAAAVRGGVPGAARWLSAGGGPQFAFGGIVDKIKGAVSGAKALVIKGSSALLDKGASVAAKGILDPILNMAKQLGGNSPWVQAMRAIPPKLIDSFIAWLKKAIDPKLGGDATGVVKAAASMIGQGDDRGANNNWLTRAWGMPGAPWCAMFVSEAIKKAGAQKRYGGYPSAAVASYVGAMKHVGEGRPGDLGAYRGSGHINVIEKNLGGGMYQTIGGNENAVVRRGTRGGQTSILRPKFGLGGIVAQQARQIFLREAPRNADPHELQTPLVQFMRGLKGSDVGPAASAIIRNGVSTFDSGGWLQPGYTLAYNGTGRPEAVTSFARGGTVAKRKAAKKKRAAQTRIADTLTPKITQSMWRSPSKIGSFFTTLNTNIMKQFSGGTEKRMLAWSSSIQKAMSTAATKAEGIAKQIADAKEYATQITTSAKEFAQLSNLPAKGSAVNIASGLEGRVTTLTTFADQITQLQGRGLTKGLLSQVIGMGPGEGSTVAAALLGGDSEVFARLNTAQARIDKVADTLGRTAADVMYDSGKGAGRGFLTGLYGQQAALNKYMDSLGSRLASGVRLAFKTGKPGSVKIVKYDSGGYLPTGASLVYNGTGRPEPVLTTDQFTTLASRSPGTDGAGAAAPHIEQHFHELPFTPSQMAREAAREAAWELRG